MYIHCTKEKKQHNRDASDLAMQWMFCFSKLTSINNINAMWKSGLEQDDPLIHGERLKLWKIIDSK